MHPPADGYAGEPAGSHVARTACPIVARPIVARPIVARPVGVWPLMGLKSVLLRNRVMQMMAESPLKLAVGLAMLVMIWLGLFGLFTAVFIQFEQSRAEAAVVVPIVFDLFFLALLIMLAFSSAVISYGSLFGWTDMAFLMATPIRPTHLVMVKYVESLFFASWSFVLLGLPLMVAMALRENVAETLFYPLFAGFFLCFVPIPGAAGLALACFAARYLLPNTRRFLLLLGGLLVCGLAWWAMRVAHASEDAGAMWIDVFLARVQIVETALLPSTWVARGIDNALRNQYGTALGYLWVTAANAILLSWIVVRFFGRRFVVTYDRAMASGSDQRRANGNSLPKEHPMLELFFCYLPRKLRMIAAKDLLSFLRDPLQWSQLAVLFGLMALYLLNASRFHLVGTSFGRYVPFLNLGAVSLMLATFTSRFVFPMISLEGRQLWLIGLLPLSRKRVVTAKFAYALTVTGTAALATTGLAAVTLQLHWAWSIVHLSVTLALCFGLCGFAVGLGARMPMFSEPNPGRIANGLGGTINLVMSVLLVTVILAGVLLAISRSTMPVNTSPPHRESLYVLLATIAFAVAAGWTALWVGARHFARVQP